MERTGGGREGRLTRGEKKHENEKEEEKRRQKPGSSQKSEVLKKFSDPPQTKTRSYSHYTT